MSVVILGIESSCDDTAAAVLVDGVTRSSVIASQRVHEAFGGVVPELASRAHQQNIVPVVDLALKEAGVSADELDAVAFTRGPGLMGSLLVGVSFAKGLSIAKGIPLIEVNHLQAHILANFIKERETSGRQATDAEVPGKQSSDAKASGGHSESPNNTETSSQSNGNLKKTTLEGATEKLTQNETSVAPGRQATDAEVSDGHPEMPNSTDVSSGQRTATELSNTPSFPFLTLLVSGGNSQIVVVRDYLDMEMIGQTIDDAAGEAFDKCAKVMGLPYPGGPVIDKLAREGRPRFTFSKPHIPGLDYSFSGLKTSFLYFLRDRIAENPNFIEENLTDLCASLQKTIIEILMEKLVKAAKETGIREIAIGGGVSANSGLQEAVREAAERYGWRTFIPRIGFSVDNAAMVATAGYYKFLHNDFAPLSVAPFVRTTI